MRRLFWVALGATAGVLVVRKITRAADSLPPDGAVRRLSQGLGGLTEAVREFADDVATAMAAREAELRQALGIGDRQATADVADLATVTTPTSTNPRGTD